MKVTVHNSEKFERGQLWYIIFSCFFVSFIALLLIDGNFVGAILLFFLLGWYLFFSISNNQSIEIIMLDEFLQIWPKAYPRGKLTGFVIEIEPQKQDIKNIVFLIGNQKLIHSFDDSKEHIKNFIVSLSDKLPMMGEYEQTFTEKLSRKLKL